MIALQQFEPAWQVVRLRPGYSDAHLDPATGRRRMRAMFVRGRSGPDVGSVAGSSTPARRPPARRASVISRGDADAARRSTLRRRSRFRPVHDHEVVLPDGLTVAAVAMEMAIPDPSGG